MKKPQIQRSWIAAIAALGAAAAMLPAQAADSAAGDVQSRSSAHSLDAQGRSAAGSAGGLTREQVREEALLWREAGLIDALMSGDDDAGRWRDPEIKQTLREVNAQVHAQRAMEAGQGVRDAER